MRHKVKKIKFNFGKDANKMLLRKLAINFFEKGYLETTLAKAKVLKSYLEKIISKVKKVNEKNKKYLLRKIGSVKTLKKIEKIISQSFTNISGGYVKVIKTDLRDGDGSLLAKVQWAHPILKIDDENKKEIKVKNKKEIKEK